MPEKTEVYSQGLRQAVCIVVRDKSNLLASQSAPNTTFLIDGIRRKATYNVVWANFTPSPLLPLRHSLQAINLIVIEELAEPWLWEWGSGLLNGQDVGERKFIEHMDTVDLEEIVNMDL